MLSTAPQSRPFRRGMASSLRIQPPPIQQIPQLNSDDQDTPNSEDSSRNMKKLSLSLPGSANSAAELPRNDRPRRPSIISLPAINPTPVLNHRKDEDLAQDGAAPYVDGPIQVIPGIWIGSEDNARDWKGLLKHGIRSVLNVAKEVASPFDSSPSLRSVTSTPDFRSSKQSDSTYYPAHLPTGRPAMHYLKLQWSHGQQDLVQNGFQEGFNFADAALQRGEGCLIHCQCGISRSATMVIALVMRAAAERLSSVPPEVWALKGMQGAYAFVKEKSPCVGPNMSLIFQLLEYEKKLRGDAPSARDSDSASVTDEEEEWGRRRQALEDASEEDAQDRQNNLIMQQEAQALDKAMEDRIVARKSSASSISSVGSGLGMGPAWRSRYARKRTGSVGSTKTSNSFISEELVEEDEEQELLGGRTMDSDNESHHNEDTSPATSPEDDVDSTPRNVSLLTPLTARPPPFKSAFVIPPPLTAIRSTFQLPPAPPPKPKRRPVSLNILPPVPSSPVNVLIDSDDSSVKLSSSLPPVRQRTESRRLPPPPLHLRNSVLRKASNPSEPSSSLNTPSQTLFVFPPSPTLNTRTPSTMTLMSNHNLSVPFPSLSTPRVSKFQSKGRTRSFIGLGPPPTPTVGFSKVDARGYVGIE